MGYSGLARAIYDYVPQNDEEIALHEEELVFVVEKEDEWWTVKGKDRDAPQGLVPASYLEQVSPIPPKKRPPDYALLFLDSDRVF